MDGGSYIETTSELPVLRQGTVVEYKIPQAIEPEVSAKGSQRAIVLSSTEFNKSGGTSICVCPFYEDTTSANKTHGLRVLLQSGQVVYVRPDLSSYVDLHRLCIIPRLSDGKPWVWSTYNVQRTIFELINIIKFDEKKISEPAADGFLRYGEVGWFKSIPHRDSEECCMAPAVCLTPPSLYKKTGLAIIARRYSHMERGNPRLDVGVSCGPFGIGFVATTSLMTISIDRLSRRIGEWRANLNERALKGIEKKVYGSLDSIFYEKNIATRYSDIRNNWPPEIMTELRSLPHTGRQRPNFLSLTR